MSGESTTALEALKSVTTVVAILETLSHLRPTHLQMRQLTHL